jgi:hypothetical protein
MQVYKENAEFIKVSLLNIIDKMTSIVPVKLIEFYNTH